MVGSDGDARKGIFGRKHDPVARRQGQRLDGSICLFLHGAVRVPRKNSSRRVIQNESLSKVGGRQKFEVESSLAGKRRSERLIQVYGYAEAACLWLDFDPITQTAVGVGAESRQLVLGRSTLALTIVRNWIPLPGRRRQPHISVGGNPLLMQDDFEPAHFLIAEDGVIGIV